MNSHTSSCDICLSDYNNTNRTPYMIPMCGHSMCSSCLITFLVSSGSNEFTCPFDGKTMILTEPGINHFPKNYSLIKVVSGPGPNSPDQAASRQIDDTSISGYMCLSPEEQRSPDLRKNEPASEELELVVSNKLGNLKKVITDIETFEKNIYNKIEEAVTGKEKYMLETLEAKITECHDLLDRKKKEIADKLAVHFANVKDKVRSRVNPNESQIEAKTTVLKWKEATKNKIDNWDANKTIGVANTLIEEDETAMLPEITVWTKRLETVLAAGNLETLVDKSFFAFNEEFTTAVNALCEFRIVSEQDLGRQDVFNEEDTGAFKDALRINSRVTSYFSTETKNLLNKLFKAYNLKLKSDCPDSEKLVLKPNLNLLLSSNSKDKRKISMGGDFDEIESLQIFCDEFKDKHLVNFAESLQNLELLKQLNVILTNGDKLTESALETFGTTIGSLPVLESLTLDHVSTSLKISDQTLSKFAKAMNTTQTLQKLTLTFEQLSGVTPTGFAMFWKDLAGISSLKQLKITAPVSLELEDEDFATISISLKKMTGLQELELVVPNSQKITNKGLMSLSEALGKLINLTKLKLKFHEENANINDKGFSSLVAALSKLGLLNSLTLELPKSYITNEKFVEFAQVLSKFSSLRHLNLDFSWSLISDEGLKELSKAVSNLYNLTSFGVDLSACNMSNLGFKSLLNVISGLFNLHKLSLNFAWCKDITDESVLNLGEAISRLSHLGKLEVNFRESKKITEASALKLCGLIPKFNNIEYFDFNLMNCGKDITKDSEIKLDMALSTGRRKITRRITVSP